MSFRFNDNFDAVIAALDESAKRCVKETAQAVAETARENAPEQSGALKAGIYSALAGDNAAYEVAVSAVSKANPKVEVSSNGLEDFSGEGVHAAIAESIVDYSSLIHNGYSNAAGRPFLEDAFNANEGTFKSNLNQIGDDLKKF